MGGLPSELVFSLPKFKAEDMILKEEQRRNQGWLLRTVILRVTIPYDAQKRLIKAAVWSGKSDFSEKRKLKLS